MWCFLQPQCQPQASKYIQSPDTPKVSLTSWKDSDRWEEQTRVNDEANREGLFRRSRGPGGQCNTVTGHHVRPREGDAAFLRGRTGWVTEWPAQGHTASRRRGWVQTEEARGAGMWPPGRVREVPPRQGPVSSTAWPQSLHPERETGPWSRLQPPLPFRAPRAL